MTTTRSFRVLPLAGLAAAALVLSGCGNDEPMTTTEPAAPMTSAAAPTATEPAGSAPAQSTTTDPSGRTTEVPENDVDLDVEDQSGNGSQVVIEQVRLTGGTGFVAVYDRAGTLLGSAQVGSDAGLTVDLDRAITETGEHTAVLFADDGDGAFDADQDLRVVEAGDDTDDDDSADVVDDDFDYTVR